MTDIDERLDAVIIKQVFSKDIVYGLRMQQTSRIANEAADEIERLRKENEQLRSQMVLFDPSTTQVMAAATLNFANDTIGQLQERNHFLRQRVKLLEGYLNWALNLVDNFVYSDTSDARKALEDK